jgi:signal transduction histidine kinase
MDKIVAVGFMLMFLGALLSTLIGQWLWAKVLGVFSLVPFLFGVWRRKSRGVLTIVLSIVFIAYVLVSFWLYPTGVVGIAGTSVNRYDVVIVLLTVLVVTLSLLELHKDRWRRNRGEDIESPDLPRSGQ